MSLLFEDFQFSSSTVNLQYHSETVGNLTSLYSRTNQPFGGNCDTILMGNIHVFTHKFSCLPLKSSPLPPWVVYTPALREIWVCDQGRNTALYTRIFWEKFCKTFFSVAKLFPSKIDQYQREFCSSHLKDGEHTFSALADAVNLEE